MTSKMRAAMRWVSLELFYVVSIGAALLQGQSPVSGSLDLEGNIGSIQYPIGWSVREYSNVRELWNTTHGRLSALSTDERDEVARIHSSVTVTVDHAEALHRLREIEAEWGMTSTYMVTGGWPALQRKVLVPKPREGDEASSAPEYLVMFTTAIAADASLIRVDGFAPENASSSVVTQMESIGNGVRITAKGNLQQSEAEVEQLRVSPSLRMGPPSASLSSALIGAIAANTQTEPTRVSNVAPGTAVNLGTANLQIGSESEVAVSSNGTNIVVAQQCSFKASADGGATFPFGGGAPGRCTGGDASVAVGQSGNFYWSNIASNNNCPSTNTNCNNAQQIARSTNNGQSFFFVNRCSRLPGNFRLRLWERSGSGAHCSGSS